MADVRGPRSVRARVTTGAVAIVGVALLLASVVLVLITSSALENSARSAADLRAQDFVALLESGTAPDQLHIRVEEDVVVQVIDPGGSVVASSPSLDTGEPIAQLAPGESRRVDGPPGDEDDPFIVVAAAAHAPDGEYVVLVGRNLDSAVETTRTITLILLIAVPLILLVVLGTAWVMVGRSLAQLEAARSRQQRFVSDASHELRNPIAAIRQHVEVALNHPEGAAVAELAEDVLTEDLRLQQIAEDLLLLARADEGMLNAKVAPVDIDDIVQDEARRLIKSTSLAIDHADISGARVMGDPAHVQRLIRNLVENAAVHASANVRLAVTQNDGRVILQVDDDGPGVPEAERDSIFERFARLDEARGRKRGGAGLGLAIVHELTMAMGGRVDVHDSPLGGARFEVSWPAAGR